MGFFVVVGVPQPFFPNVGFVGIECSLSPAGAPLCASALGCRTQDLTPDDAGFKSHLSHLL